MQRAASARGRRIDRVLMANLSCRPSFTCSVWTSEWSRQILVLINPGLDRVTLSVELLEAKFFMIMTS
jgi:hypothetical protein